MKKLKAIILPIIFVAIVVAISILFTLNYNTNNKTIKLEQKKSNETVLVNENDDVLNEDESSLKQFLITQNAEKYISTDNVVGSGCPEGYVFLADGNFAWTNGEYSPTQDNRKLSYRGTWEIKNNKLILTIQEEENAIGGKIEEDAIFGNQLVNYKKEIKRTNKTVEYKIDGIKYLINETQQKALTLNYGNIKLYELHPGEDYINGLKSIAENGYKNASNE